MIDNNKLQKQLFALADEKYKSFHQKLIPAGTALIGVRMPQLKTLAKDIASHPDDARQWLINANSGYYEERLLQGLVIALLKTDASEQLTLIKHFLPLIDNWAICDSFCASLKSFKKIQPKGFSRLVNYLKTKKPYTQRFGIVMILNHFADREHTASALHAFEKISSDDYYVKMAVAWAVSIFFIKERTLTLDWLKSCQLDNFTYNKALQKICESYRVTKEDKLLIRSMKR